MSTSNAAGSGRRTAASADAPQTAPTWHWQLAKAALFYVAFQGIAGPNGLVAYMQGRTEFQKGSSQSTSIVPEGQDQSAKVTTTAQTAAQNPFSVPNGHVSRVPANTTTTALFEDRIAMDVYIFVTTSGPPTTDDLSTQYSTLVQGNKGPRSVAPINFDDKEIANLLQDPVRDGILAWSPKKKGGQVLGGVKLTNVTVNDDKLSRQVSLNLDVPFEVQTANASLWADIYATRAGVSPADERATARSRKLLTRLYPQRKEREEKNLFSRSNETTKEEAAPSRKAASAIPFLDREVMPIITHWHPNLTLAIVGQEVHSGYTIGNLPPPVLQWIHVAEDEDGVILMKNVADNYPIIFTNDFWHLREHMRPVNSSQSTLPLHINLYTTSYFKFQLLAAMTDSFEKQPGMASGELDLIKQTLLETSPWYLMVTVAVSILHSIFEFLAFSSDVSHWRKKENMTGVSLGTILTNIFVQLIILLYLVDQSQETSWMILGSQGISIVIEAWKLTKAVIVTVVPRKAGEGVKWLRWLPYRVNVQDRHILSEEEKKTQEYDKLAFRIVACFAAPLLGGYAVYSAVYQTHKGWWSFVITTLTSFVYAFGFVSLIPQLIVNYKLKSTAGMNAKVFTFKILSTVVDDFFAFAIKMPTLHRLACFRDDLVFLVFLYQRWIYGEDKQRANEYGMVMEPKAEKEAKKEIGSEGTSVETKKSQ